MIWIWAFLVIAIVVMLVALVLGLVNAAASRWHEPEEEEIDEAMAERMTRPDGNVTLLRKDDE